MLRAVKFAVPAAMLALAACATPFRADVSRFQQMPVPQGQTFAIVADNPRLQGGLEFATYADMVGARLRGLGYVQTRNQSDANLLVSLDYGVDRGREKVRSVPGSGFGYGGFGYGGFGYGRLGYGGFGYPYWGGSHFGYGRRSFVYGFHDPFLFGGGFGNDQVESYTVYNSALDMKIERRGNKERVFEGTAKAMSTDDDLTTLVPNLIEAMFTNFPGRSGETVKITIAPPERRRS